MSGLANNSFALLQDNGNLVLLSGTSGTIMWQSFYHPTNSLLPQRLLIYKDMNENPVLRSWKGASNPSSGRFTLKLIPGTLLEFLTEYDDKPYWRSGPWQGNGFNGVPDLHAGAGNGFSFLNENYELEIIDVHQQPLVAMKENIIALPLLIKKHPLPEKRLIGDMSDMERVLKSIGLPNGDI